MVEAIRPKCVLSMVVSITLLFLTTASRADPLFQTAFSSSATTLDFEGLTGGTHVTNQFAAQGVIWYGRSRNVEDGDPVLPSSGNVALTNTNLYNVTCIDVENPNSCNAQIGEFRVVATTLSLPSYGTNTGVIGAALVDPLSGNLASTTSVAHSFSPIKITLTPSPSWMSLMWVAPCSSL